MKEQEKFLIVIHEKKYFNKIEKNSLFYSFVPNI